MKKIYQKPELELIATEMHIMEDYKSGITGDGGIGSGGDGDGEEGDANQYSINLWDDGEE